MAQCEAQIFSGVTGEHFAQFLARGEQLGLPSLAGNGHTGEASHMGVTIRWAFDEPAQTLTVECTKSPMLLPCTLINGKIREAVSSVLGRAVLTGVPAPEDRA